MYFKLLYSVSGFICVILLEVLTVNIAICEQMQIVGSSSEEAILKTAFYEGMKQDEFMKSWLVLGPIDVFPAEPEPQNQEIQKQAFDSDLLTQHGGESGIKPMPGLTHRINIRDYQWRLVDSRDDVVDLVKVYGKIDFVVAYAWAEINIPEATAALLGIGSDDAVKVWLNGELVHENWIGRPVNKDDDLVPVNFLEGRNQLLLKIQNQQFDWGFSCRILGHESLAEKFISLAGQGQLDDLKMLLSHGVDVNTKIGPGLTALHSAKIHGREDAVKYLLDNGADPDIQMPEKESLVDMIFDRVIRGDSPGASVLVAKDGEILYQMGYGFANLEHSVLVTPETKFRIGSISKQFTAAAILKLQEEGLLSVKDPLSKFIPDYPKGDEVTIHHLLTHTSGIHSYTSKQDFMDTVTVEIKPEDLVNSFKNDPFDFNPGEKWLYNNSGYFLLGYIVEKVSGLSLGDYLRKTFFDPLGMRDTGGHQWSLILKHEANGYSYEGGKFQKALNWDMSRAGGAGALYSTVGDLYRWNEAVFNGRVLSQPSLEAAFTPVKLNDGSAGGGGYGYGWAISEQRGFKEIQHGGGLNGFSTFLARYPEQSFTVAVLTNCASPPPGLNPVAAAQEIAEIYLWEQMKPRESFVKDTTVKPSVYDAYVGRYDYGSAVLTVTKEGDRLFAQLTGQPKFEIFPRSETEFFWKVVDAQITFVKGGAGEVTHAIHRQGGVEFKAPKLKEEKIANVDPAIYDAYTGRYDFKQIGTLTVTKEEGRLFIQMTGQPKAEIFPSSETEFFLKVVNAQLTFIKDDRDTVIKVRLNQGGITIEAPKIK